MTCLHCQVLSKESCYNLQTNKLQKVCRQVNMKMKEILALPRPAKFASLSSKLGRLRYEAVVIDIALPL